LSGRAERGELWSPRNGVDLPETDHALPELLDVPGRTAIRIHALNQVSQTAGCIGVGKSHNTDEIQESRLALTTLMRKMDYTLQTLFETVTIHVYTDKKGIRV